MTKKRTADDPGTRFPFINLEKAIGRARQLYEADAAGRQMLVPAAFGVWNYSEKSSGGFQTIGALKSYGIIDDTGAGEGRKIGLTAEALKFFKDEREEECAKLLKEFALHPPMLRALWKEWGATPPADTVARSHLKVDRELNEQSARSLLAIYKDNLDYADIKGSDKVLENNGSWDDENKPLFDPAIIQPDQKPELPIAKRIEAKPGMKQDIFTLEEGDVIFQWPETISAASYEDLEGWMAIQMRKIKRRVVDESGSSPSASMGQENKEPTE